MPAWGELLNELQAKQNPDGSTTPGLTLDELRGKYLEKLSKHTGRNVIAYYSGWLNDGKTKNIDINDSDMTGFMNAMNGMDFSRGVDLILHTPGGRPTAAEGIVKYLHQKFDKDIRVFVPQMAMSAGTMLSCSAQCIYLGCHSCLGPIDPQYGGIPAYNILQEFKDAKGDLENNPQSKEYWKLIFEKYPAAFYYAVLDGINLSSILLSDWLTKYMFFEEEPNVVKKKVRAILNKLNSNNKSHSRHFTYDFCREIGVNVKRLEDDQDLQELVLSVHHSYIITLDATNVTKIIENQSGQRYLTRQGK